MFHSLENENMCMMFNDIVYQRKYFWDFEYKIWNPRNVQNTW